MVADGEAGGSGRPLERDEIGLELGELRGGEGHGLDQGAAHAREAEEGHRQHAGAELGEVVGRGVGPLHDLGELDADEGLRVEEEHAVAMDDEELVLAAPELVEVEAHAGEVELLAGDEVGDGLFNELFKGWCVDRWVDLSRLAGGTGCC